MNEAIAMNLSAEYYIQKSKEHHNQRAETSIELGWLVVAGMVEQHAAFVDAIGGPHATVPRHDSDLQKNNTP